MKTNLERFKKDINRLSAQGVSLLNAIQVEVFPDKIEEHFLNVLKKDFIEFKKGLPVFKSEYQLWYSEALQIIKLFLPERLEDFRNYYETPKGRKEVRQDNYVVEDYLKDLYITSGFDKKVVAGPSDAIPQFQQQLNIFNSVTIRFESTLIDIHKLVKADLFDSELESAMELIKNNLYRSAGVLCGIVLDKHLQQVAGDHNLKIGKKTPKTSDYNDLLKKTEVYDFNQWRFIKILGEIKDLCYQSKKREPTLEEIVDLVEGVDKVIKTIF